jgi:hypothetical protein
MWGSNIHEWVVNTPLILASAYLGLSIYLDSIANLDLLPVAMWLVSLGMGGRGSFGYQLEPLPDFLIHGTEKGNRLTLAALATSMTVNALVTGLMIFMVFRKVRSVTTLGETSLGVTGATILRSVFFIIIESGMALFAIQLVRLVLVFRGLSTTGTYVFIVSIHEMLNVIILINHCYFISY